MSDVRRKISLFLLLLLFTMTAVAQDAIVQRGCRKGTPRPQGMLLHRGAPTGQTKQAGGDFYHGNRHQLTVLVAFNDRAFKGDEAATMEQWNKIFNVENLSEAPFKGSVHDYFLAQSYGDFNLVFDLLYVQVSGDAKKYASTDADDENSQFLVQDIMEELKSRNINWSLYDWNGDGFINQLLIVYAGKGMNDGGGSNTIWPHQWWMSEHLKDRQPGVYCDPIPVTYGDKEYQVDCYCALAELTSNNDYGSFGTICHEYTHCFGFPDFYCGSTKFVYDWDLMDTGNYSGDGYCPPCYSAHERWLMGWLKPTELIEATEVSNMQALADEPQAYLIRNDGHPDEYYIVENRQKKGWDSYLPGSGIMIFHIDFDPSIWTSTKETPNYPSYISLGITYPAQARYVLFHANNSSMVSMWGYPYLSRDSLTNNSSPAAILYHGNADGSLLMNKSLHDMKVENGLASFRFTVPPTTGIEERKAEGTPQVLYRLGPVTILRYPNGVIRKVVLSSTRAVST